MDERRKKIISRTLEVLRNKFKIVIMELRIKKVK